MQIGISVGIPRAARICMAAAVWLRRVGRSQREADSGGWLISWTATHQLLATNMCCYYGGGLEAIKRSEETEIPNDRCDQ